MISGSEGMGEHGTGRRPGRRIIAIVGKASAHQCHRSLEPAAPLFRLQGIPRRCLDEAVEAQRLARDLDQRIAAERRDQPVETERLGDSRAEFLR